MMKLHIFLLPFFVMCSSIAATGQTEIAEQHLLDCNSKSVETSLRIVSCEHAATSNDLTMLERSQIFLTLGHLQADLAQYELALVAFQNAISANTENNTAIAGKETLLHSVSIALANEPASLVSFASMGLRDRPLDVDLLLLRAEAFAASGSLTDAIADFERVKALVDGPHSFAASLVNHYIAVGRFDHALLELDEFIADVSPGGTYEREILARKNSGQLGEEDEDMLENLPLLYPFSLYNKTTLYMRMDDYVNALRISDSLVEIAPDEPDFVFVRGVILARLGRYPDALSHYETLLDLIENRSNEPYLQLRQSTHLSRAQIYVETGNVELAVADYDMAYANAASFDILKMQKNLQSSGQYLGELDGVYSGATREALLDCIGDQSCVVAH